ncbi:MAG: FtsX-like permease family protein [Rikenellaceae bacterium]
MINIIAGVSLVSVAIPVAAIIILLSIFNGFGSLVEGMNSSVDAPLTIRPIVGRYFEASEIDSARLAEVEGVECFAYVSEQTMMLDHMGREAVVTLRGVDDNYTRVVPIDSYMRAGDFSLRMGDLDRLVVGNAMAYKLGLANFRVAEVGVYSLRESRLSSFVPVVDFVRDSAGVSGIFILDGESEERYVYAPLRFVNRIVGDEQLSSVAVRVADGHSVEQVRARVKGVVGDGFSVLSREELNPVLYDIIKYEKWGILFISAMVMILASFSLIGIVAMLIIEKRADMTTLRMMGATWSDIRRIFFLQGMLISGVGAFLGVVVGVAVTLIQQLWGVVKLPAGAFVVDAYPVNLQLWDVAWIVALTLGVAMVLNYIVTLEMIKKRTLQGGEI